MALLSFSPLSRFASLAACAFAFAGVFSPHTLTAQTAPASSSGGLFPELNQSATRAFNKLTTIVSGAHNIAKVVDGFITTEDEEEEKRAQEAAKSRMERVTDNLGRVDEYMDLKERQDAFERGDPGARKLPLREKTRLNVLEGRLVGEWKDSQIAWWEARTGQTWQGGNWSGDFGHTYRVAEAISPENPGRVLAVGAGLQEYFTQILMAPKR